MNIIDRIKLIILSEFNQLYINLKKEINYVLSLSFKIYLKKLIFPEDYSYLFIIFRILTLFIFFRFFYDIILFFLKILFNIYFIIMERFFEILIKLNQLFFEDLFFFRYFLKVIRFFRYIFLFMFFVNIKEDLRRKRIPL